MINDIAYYHDLRTSLRSQTLARHVEQHAALYGSDFEQCPNIECRRISELLKDIEPAINDSVDVQASAA